MRVLLGCMVGRSVRSAPLVSAIMLIPYIGEPLASGELSTALVDSLFALLSSRCPRVFVVATGFAVRLLPREPLLICKQGMHSYRGTCWGMKHYPYSIGIG